MNVHVFVDYDNVVGQERRKGLVYVAERILQTIIHGASGLVAPTRFAFRLYGGWYGGTTPTRLAQNLAVEISAHFPRRSVIPTASPVTCLVGMELAYSLDIDPSRHLLHTYRRQGAIDDVSCRPPIAAGCTEAACALTSMHQFLTSGGCAMSGCAMTPADFLFRGQQKLVDTMLAADVIHLAHVNAEPLCVVTSDDDLWPAIKTALVLGRTVLHVQTRPGKRTPNFYSAGSGPLYLELVF